MNSQKNKKVSVSSSSKKKPRSRKNKKQTSSKSENNIRNIDIAPSSVSINTVTKRPRFRQGGNGQIIVRHREYVNEVTSGGGFFRAVQYKINPGLSESFPWLSQIANAYESYRFLRLSFSFVTERPTTDTGSVTLAMDYDAADTPPTSKSEALQMQGAVRSSVWSHCELHCDSKDLHKIEKELYTRSTPSLPANLDVKTYDVGQLFVCTDGLSAALNIPIGELWMDYEVALQTPQVDFEASLFRSSARIVKTGSQTANNFTGGAVKTGGMPFIITNPTTLTFTQKVEGIYTGEFYSAAANIAPSPSPVTTGSTAAIANALWLVNSAFDTGSFDIEFSANPGNTLIIDYSGCAPVIDIANHRFGTYQFSLG